MTSVGRCRRYKLDWVDSLDLMGPEIGLFPVERG